MSQNYPHFERRTFLAGTGAVVALAAIAACGSPGGKQGVTFAQPAGDVPSAFQKRLRVVAWTTWGGATGKAVAELARRFNESQTDIFLDLQSQNGNYDDLAQKLATGLQARQVPDLAVFSEVTWHKFFLNDTLEPLDSYFGSGFSKDVYNKALMNEGVIGDKLWWLPFARSTPLFYYNRDLFKQIGLPDRGPDTWSEVRQWSQELKGLTYKGSKPKMFAYPKVDGDWMFQGVLWNFGGGISDGLHVTIDSPGSIAAGEFERTFVNVDKMAYVTDSPVTDFQNGLIATVEDSTGVLKGIVANSHFEVGAAFVPGEKSKGVPTGGGGFSIMAGAAKERKEGAFEFLKFLARPENSAAWTVSTGYMPVIEAAKNEPTYASLLSRNPNFGVAVKQLPTTKREDEVRLFVPNANITLYGGLQRIWSKNEPTEVVFADVAKKLKTATEKIRPAYEARVK